MNKLTKWLVLALIVCLLGYLIVSVILVILPLLALALGFGAVMAVLVLILNAVHARKKRKHWEPH